MKRLSLIVCLLLVTSFSYAQKSPKKDAKGTINEVAVSIDYSSPSVRGRQIWGDLVPYDKVWRAGANENTTVTFDKDVKIGETVLKAGKYGFFVIPKNNDNWTVIFNTKNDSWGAYSYKENEDAVRVNIKPEFAETSKEALEYTIDEGAISLLWEKVKLTIPVVTEM